MSVKDNIDKKLQRAAEDAAAAKPAVVIPAQEDDAELKAAMARVQAGELKAAYRTRNGTLVKTH